MSKESDEGITSSEGRVLAVRMDGLRDDVRDLKETLDMYDAGSVAPSTVTYFTVTAP